ncbi:MAG: NADH-quinone oxidoreductase subunit L [Planctomycetes bacterium]|nr:NADH-quinone oxidoreductase subunit L [Planctomycetota bacterium]
MADQLWLWAIPGLPLLGSALCGLIYFLGLERRTAPSVGAHGAHGDSGAHGAGHGAAHQDHGAHGAPAVHGAHGTHGDEGDAAAHHGPSAGARLASLLACGAMAVAFALAIKGFLDLRALPLGRTALESPAWHWIRVTGFEVDISMVLDRLSAVMCLVITGVGFLIHVYSVGYMKHDAGFAKFFAYLNLFVFAMLMLVLSSSLLGLFIGWEGVGLCSYLLIGFWYAKGWPAEAAQKAFVMNRIGDASFLVGSFLLVQLFGTLDLSDIAGRVREVLADGSNRGQLILAALLLFGGCCGKSAQFPLFTWLPDAMAGPTPVSALIHAATMVTAGIYLVVRLNPLFAVSETVMLVIAIVGALTAFIGATTALVQRDIKKVLAYSTVSQLGYMFLGLGSGAFASAIFHLVTHAFFKGLLFLGAGSVIHGMHDEQDMHKMGGLKSKMPRTFLTFLCGAAALSGLPLMSGFFSKDEILAFTFANGGVYYALWGLGLVTAAVTAFYTWRMVALTFFGEPRYDAKHVHPHESPAVMTVPLMVLAVLSVLGGVLGLPPVFQVTHALEHWLEPVLEPGRAILAGHHDGHLPHPSHLTEWVLLGVGSAVALFFAHRGFHAYKAGIQKDTDRERNRPALAGFLGDAWRIDTTYAEKIVQPLKLLSFVTYVVIDQFGIDGAVNGTGALARATGGALRTLTDGRIKTYAIWIGLGATGIVFLWMWS